MKTRLLGGGLLDLFLPRGCVACGDRISPEEGSELTCIRCRTLLRRPPPPRCPRCDVPQGTSKPSDTPCLECANWPEILVSARAAVVMEPPADSLVHALKYGGWRSLGKIMGLRMVRAGSPFPASPLLVPIPTTPRRKRHRGYNQAQVLADAVGEALKVRPVEVLERHSGRTQVRSGPAERRSNVRSAFQMKPCHRSRIRGAEVILIDDVLTTGATAAAAASVLGRGGARSVRVLTFARTLPFGNEGRSLLPG